MSDGAPTPRRRVRVLVSGRVQGVAFRAYAQARARELGLAGWVRNLANRRVEACFDGAPERVEAMLAWCRDEGSPASRVTGVEVREETPITPPPRGFEIVG